ncbi:MAG: TRAP transporter small permease subunit [Bacteroidota bacterium]
MIHRLIIRFLRAGTIISTLGLLASVVWQIFARFFLPSAPAWTEEASRLFFIYSVAFAGGLALEKGEFVQLEWFYEKLSSPIQSVLKIIIPVCSFILFLVVGGFAIQFMLQGHAEFAPGMKIRMSWVFLSMVIMGLSLSYVAATHIRDQIKPNA